METILRADGHGWRGLPLDLDCTRPSTYDEEETCLHFLDLAFEYSVFGAGEKDG